ncbi:MAG: hypothetical protein U0793_06000 [Gemmataceae bacterium]
MKRIIASLTLVGVLIACAPTTEAQRPLKKRFKSRADLAAVSLTHVSRLIGFGGPDRIVQHAIAGEVKNVSKIDYAGDCQVRLLEGALRDDGSIADDPRLLFTRTLRRLGAGERYVFAVDVKVNYWDPKTIYILEISHRDANPDNNRLTKQFERPPVPAPPSKRGPGA